MADWSVLSNDLKVCSVIYEYTNVKGDKVWLSKLEKIMSKDMSRVTLSKSLDKLFDLGMIDGKWEDVDGRWVRVFRVAGEAEDLIKSVYSNTKRPA